MPSSSLFLRSSATLISVLSLFSTSTSAASQYSNVKSYSGNSFYDGFNFFTDSDPTHGFVDYVDKNTALFNGLTRLDNGVFRMGVDSDSILDPTGVGRASVRLESKDAFTKGLFIIDLLHMPGNVCGIWPAFWTTVNANTWPVGGEIDIVESISNRVISSAVLHTNGTSIINSDMSTMSGTVQTTDCRYDVATNSNAAGCAIANTDPGSYGAGLNSNGGRIFAMEWTDDTVKVWSFPRSSYPKDIDSGNPDPSKWGLPVQNFAGASANIKTNLFNHKIVINTDFCGDFGDAVWSGEGCAASTGYTTCAGFVANNPAAFVDQFWSINSLKVFQRADSVSTTTTSSSTTSSSSSTTSSSTTSSSISSSSSTTSSGFTTSVRSSSSSVTTTTSTISLSTISASTTTQVTVTDPILTTSSSGFTFSTTSPTSSHSFDTMSRGFTYTNGSSTISTISTTSISTSSFGNPILTTSTNTLTTSPTNTLTTSPTNSLPSTISSSSTSSSLTTSPTISTSITAPIISASTLPGYAQGGSQRPQQWSAWATPDPTPTFITTTITTSYLVPCSTGLSTSTVSVTTSFAGGKKMTYTPKVAVTTYTTSCPVEWGFGGIVTVTAPVTETKRVGSVETGGVKGGNGNGNGSGSGNGGNGGSNSNSNTSGSSSGPGSSGGSNGAPSSNSGSNNSNGNSSGSGSGSGSSSGSNNNNGSGSNSGTGSGSVNNGGNGSGSGSSNANGNGIGNSNGNSGGNNNGWSTTFAAPPSLATPDATFKVPSDGFGAASPTASGSAASSTAYYYGTDSGSNAGSGFGFGSASGSSVPAPSSSGTGTGSGSVSVPASSGSGSDWASWINSNSNVTSPIAVYTGAASRVTGAGSLLAAVIVGVMGLMM